MAEDSAFEQELAELENEEAARSAEAETEAKKRRHLELSLARKYSAEFGKRGVDFEVVNLDLGVFAVRVPDALQYKKFIDRVGEGPEIAHQFVSTCLLFPKTEEFNAFAAARPGIAVHCANAACKLAGLLSEKRAGK